MSLRTRLVISFTVLLLAVIFTVGFVASRSIEDILVGQIDQNLLSIARDLGDPQLMEGSLKNVDVLELAGAGYPPMVSALVLVALSAGCVLFLLRRVTKPVRI